MYLLDPLTLHHDMLDAREAHDLTFTKDVGS